MSAVRVAGDKTLGKLTGDMIVLTEPPQLQQKEAHNIIKANAHRHTVDKLRGRHGKTGILEDGGETGSTAGLKGSNQRGGAGRRAGKIQKPAVGGGVVGESETGASDGGAVGDGADACRAVVQAQRFGSVLPAVEPRFVRLLDFDENPCLNVK